MRLNNGMDVLVFRQDGFEETIHISATDLPPGITCEPVVVGLGKLSVPLVLHAAKNAPIGHGAIRVTGPSDEQMEQPPVVNIVRICSLYYVGVYSPSSFELAHLEIWPAIILLVALGIFFGLIGWERRSTAQVGSGGVA